MTRAAPSLSVESSARALISPTTARAAATSSARMPLFSAAGMRRRKQTWQFSAAATPIATRLLVVGVDGATFDRIDEMDLPAFSRLAAEGSRGTLSSMEPMFSPLLWTTIASGKPPRDHGIHGFDVHADDALVPRFWDIAESQGLRIGVYKWLVTYPPREVDGFVVPAWLAPSPPWPYSGAIDRRSGPGPSHAPDRVDLKA